MALIAISCYSITHFLKVTNLALKLNACINVCNNGFIVYD